MAYELDKDCYIKATPAGVYYCTSSTKDELARNIIKVLLSRSKTPLLTNTTVETLFSVESSVALRLLHHLQKLDWVEFLEFEESVDSGDIEGLFIKLLPRLSLEGKALLTDAQGSPISSVGFSPKAATELAYLSADLISLHKRHKWLLNDNLKFPTSNWATVDAAGHSQMGFWPIHIADEAFSLVISGVPRFSESAFMQIAWLLHTRYIVQKSGQPPLQASFSSKS